MSPSTITFKHSGFRLEETTLRLSRGKEVAAETGKQFLFLELAIPPRADVSDPRYVRLVPRDEGWERQKARCSDYTSTETGIGGGVQ